jgi:hypothetical protein
VGKFLSWDDVRSGSGKGGQSEVASFPITCRLIIVIPTSLAQMHKTTVSTCNIETRNKPLESIICILSHSTCLADASNSNMLGIKEIEHMRTSSFITSNTSQHQGSPSSGRPLQPTSQSSHPHPRPDSHTADQERKDHNELQPRRHLPYTL